MSSHYYNHVGCINCKDLSSIEISLTEILGKENFKRVDKITEDLFTREVAYSYDLLSKLIRNFLIIGLFPGNYGWTFIKTLPREFFCRRGDCSTQPRLATLANKINYQAFHWSVYRNYFGILLEVSKQSEIYVSGNYPTEYKLEDELFYQEQINDNSTWKFHLIKVSEELKEAIRPETKEEWQAIEAKLAELEKLSKQGIITQFAEEDLLIGHGAMSERALWRYFGNSSQYWGGHFYLAYSEQEEIEANGGKILYFKTPEYYQHIRTIAYVEGKY
ncbi:hypothetical protein [Myxosarcina sp. GI1]|uniref:hypothetical protein n=1 Tax=Myxosarcina sp. GI1 TaxID=1541065 RepID=UPI00056B1734|nr:hypothetical protein [Myxosarcina sp. GI1]